MLSDKDWAGTLDILNEAAAEFVATTPDSPRALPAGELAEYLENYGKPVQVCPDIKEAVGAAMDAAGEEGMVCAVGLPLLRGPHPGLLRSALR